MGVVGGDAGGASRFRCPPGRRSSTTLKVVWGQAARDPEARKRHSGADNLLPAPEGHRSLAGGETTGRRALRLGAPEGRGKCGFTCALPRIRPLGFSRACPHTTFKVVLLPRPGGASELSRCASAAQPPVKRTPPLASRRAAGDARSTPRPPMPTTDAWDRKPHRISPTGSHTPPESSAPGDVPPVSRCIPAPARCGSGSR
jgi:hypothetical protein